MDGGCFSWAVATYMGNCWKHREGIHMEDVAEADVAEAGVAEAGVAEAEEADMHSLHRSRN